MLTHTFPFFKNVLQDYNFMYLLLKKLITNIIYIKIITLYFSFYDVFHVSFTID